MKKICILTILISFLLGCFLEFSIAHKTPTSSTIEIQGIPIEIIEESNDVMEKYIQDIQYTEPFLLKPCKKVVLTTDREILDKSAEKNTSEDIMAVSVANTGEITILCTEYSSRRIHHELYHLMDFSHSPGYISQDSTFQQLFNEEGNNLPLNDYERSNWKEIFVGCMLMLEKKPDEMRGEAPNLTAYLENILEDAKNKT